MKYGGPGRDRTDDLFHAMEARSQLRHRPTITAETPKPDELGSREVLSHFRPHQQDSQRVEQSRFCCFFPQLVLP